MQKPIPKFSVVIPLFNKEQTIERTIRSVLNQTIQDFEIIVVNDGSTDNGPAIAEKIGDPRIRIIHQQNQGVSAARNKGWKEARAEWIAFLDADDFWDTLFLNEIKALTDSYPDCGVYATRYQFCAGDRHWPAIIRLSSPLIDGERGILEHYFEVASNSHPPINSSAICVRKEAIEKIGGFPVGITSGEDLLTWARLAVRFKIAYSMKPLSTFHLSDIPQPAGKLRRHPDINDQVGFGLKGLLPICHPSQRSDLKRYISHWYRMRVSVFLRVPNLELAIRAWFQSVKFNPFQFKLWVFLIIAIAPRPLRITIMNRILRPA
jgi:hypothetical protein